MVEILHAQENILHEVEFFFFDLGVDHLLVRLRDPHFPLAFAPVQYRDTEPQADDLVGAPVVVIECFRELIAVSCPSDRCEQFDVPAVGFGLADVFRSLQHPPLDVLGERIVFERQIQHLLVIEQRHLVGNKIGDRRNQNRIFPESQERTKLKRSGIQRHLCVGQ